MAERVWVCKRQTNKVICGHQNPRRKQLCEACGKRRPATKKPAHMAALDISYEEYIKINGGEFCGICGKPPKEGRRLDRDHQHRGNGVPRGLLCNRCNRDLRSYMDLEWAENVVRYLKKTSNTIT